MTTTAYSNQLNELDGQAFVAMDQFKKAFILSNTMPDNPDYQDAYARAQDALAQVQAKVFSLSTSVQKDQTELNKHLVQWNKEIAKERKRNRRLRKALGMVGHKQLASEELIHDYEDIYEHIYLRNWALALSTLVCGVALYQLRPVATSRV